MNIYLFLYFNFVLRNMINRGKYKNKLNLGVGGYAHIRSSFHNVI